MSRRSFKYTALIACMEYLLFSVYYVFSYFSYLFKRASPLGTSNIIIYSLHTALATDGMLSPLPTPEQGGSPLHESTMMLALNAKRAIRLSYFFYKSNMQMHLLNAE